MRRRDVVRLLFHRDQVRDSMALSPQLSFRNSILAGIQAAMTVAIALPAIYLSPWADMIGFGALGALVALFGRFAPSGHRKRVVFYAAMVQTLTVLIMSIIVFANVPVIFQYTILAVACGIYFLISTLGKFGPPGALIFVFAAGASMGEASGWAEIAERVTATALVAGLAWVICVATEVFRHRSRPERPLSAESRGATGQWALASLRIALGAGIALLIVHTLGATYPAWAAMGAVAVMQGTHLHIAVHRALQRSVGTVLGACLAWVILGQDPSVWTLIVFLAILQFAAEVVIGTNYGLGLILVTPMALLMTQLATPDAHGVSMVSERVLDTLVGVAIGLALVVILSSLEERLHVADNSKPDPKG